MFAEVCSPFPCCHFVVVLSQIKRSPQINPGCLAALNSGNQGDPGVLSPQKASLGFQEVAGCPERHLVVTLSEPPLFHRFVISDVSLHRRPLHLLEAALDNVSSRCWKKIFILQLWVGSLPQSLGAAVGFCGVVFCTLVEESMLCLWLDCFPGRAHFHSFQVLWEAAGCGSASCVLLWELEEQDAEEWIS